VSHPSGVGAPHATSRAALLDVIRGAGQISRVDLARETGLTGATVSTVVRRLIDDGLVVEVGRAESTGGKPAVLLSIEPEARYAVGVHLDHGGITYVIADLGGAVVSRWRRPGAGADAPGAVVERMAAELGALVSQAGIDRERILGLGVVSPGPVIRSSGMALTPPVMEAWAQFPIDDALQTAVGLPVLLENDATAAAVGEYWGGQIETSRCFAALYMGTGIGAGLIVNGDVYRGASGNTGEVGHMCLDVDGPPCWCGGSGCVEALAGPAAVVAAARAAGVDLPGVGVAEDFAALSRAAMRSDGVPRRLLLRSARYLAAAARTLANLLDVDLVVLTGPSFALAGSLYVPVIRDELDRTFFGRASHPVDVLISPHASEAAAIGGAALVLQSELAPRSSQRVAGARQS